MGSLAVTFDSLRLTFDRTFDPVKYCIDPLRPPDLPEVTPDAAITGKTSEGMGKSGHHGTLFS